MADEEFYFKPRHIKSHEFLEAKNNPGEEVNEKVIDDVLNEVQPAFEEDGVSQDVLALLKKLWMIKLHERQNESSNTHEDCKNDESNTSSSADAPKPVNLGARPKSTLKNSQTVLKKKIPQFDGPNDSSDDDEDIDGDVEEDDDDDDDIDEDEDEDIDGDGEDEEEGVEEEPLGSGDDISDGDPSDLFNTENVVVCQYDKITRSRNKWKFHLKDGIMNLNGKDYVFQKATGEAEW